MPFIYNDRYNISFPVIQKLHPFDTEKYRKIYRYLKSTGNYTEDWFLSPSPVTEAELLAVHSHQYLESLNSSSTISDITELLSLRIIPPWLLRKKILQPMLYATGGTVLGAERAMQDGWAVNLSGGYHHAKKNSGEGFCFFADIPLAIHRIRRTYRQMRILIIDLDAHQGNGNASMLKNDPYTWIFDAYNRNTFPLDRRDRQHVDFNCPLRPFLNDDQYLKIIERALMKSFEVNPELIIYNAGSDILKKDLLGNFLVSEKGLMKRDELVFNEAVSRKIPILMVISGGYSRESGVILGRSIDNVIQKNHLK